LTFTTGCLATNNHQS